MVGRSVWHWLSIRLGLRAPGTQTSEAERDCLARHARGRRQVVEIGVYHGANTALLRTVMDPDGVVTGIDPFLPGRLGVNFDHWVAERQIARVPRGRARLIAKTSQDASPEWTAAIDCLFIDGDHSWEGISRDWHDWSPRVEPGGIVALHDSQTVPGKPLLDSVRFANEVALQDPRFQVLEIVDSLTVLERRHA